MCGVFVVGLVGLFFLVQPVFADDTATIAAELGAAQAQAGCPDTGPLISTCPPRALKDTLKIIGEKIISPQFKIAALQALMNLAQFVTDRLAYEAAVAIASGGPGEDSLFYNQTPVDAFGQLAEEFAGEALGSIDDLASSKLGIEFSLCTPPSDIIKLGLSIGITQKYQPRKPKCDWTKIGTDWNAFATSIAQKFSDPTARQEEILKSFASSLKPGQNELTATLRINIALDKKIHEQKLLQFLQRNENQYKSVTDFLSGTLKTPSETLQSNFEANLNSKDEKKRDNAYQLAIQNSDLLGGLALSTASTFTNTLLSQLFNRIYTGLFETEIIDPFDVEAVGTGDKEAAQERFASIIATNPIQTVEYNALSEYIVCPVSGTINRGLNNCVMDVNFLAAVNRGTAGSAITVQEAIDEGLLSGDWPLIPPDNQAANQDPFCYSYGYCYGNLVKLRKARVIPIGWELAAQRSSESNPVTLQEVIDGFNDCTEEGTIGPSGATDTTSQWCHLIDPNWVLKYPETQCRAIGIGEVRISTLSPGRNSTCVDMPSCIGEDNDGTCVGGYGYCVQEKNVWRFRGDECPEEYATCLSFENTNTGDAGDFLVRTVDYSVCDQDNAGCRWYRTNKYEEDAGTTDTDDDTYEWLSSADDYIVADRDDDLSYSGSTGRTEYSYTSDSGEIYTYEQYAYEDRIYLTNDVTECGEESAGCTLLYPFDDDLYLNTVINPSFEDDEDSDGIPDNWIAPSSTSVSLSTSITQFGSQSLSATAGSSSYVYQDVDAVGNQFYTWSFYAMAATDGDTVSGELQFLDEDGVALSAAGTSSSGDCTWSTTAGAFQLSETPASDEFERFECLVTSPKGTTQIRLYVGNRTTGTVYVEGVQLELGEDANTFAEGYNTTPQETYYRVAPDYLGCTGNETDPDECDSYAQVCSAQDVGCNLYTPEDGDPNVPAIISELDECPSECVGYTTYKQEATDYDSEEFPLYFIADSASSCSSQYVGCGSYTNLASVEAGGEGIEYYTDLRFCLSNAIADASTKHKTPATYFTWEGSDNEGYQLQTWTLLQSNYAAPKSTFDASGFVESKPNLAPCTHIQMFTENEVSCRDIPPLMQQDVWANDECDEHDDIFDNPDCREFFDTKGNIHYREYSKTVSISDDCVAYRKDEGEETDCEDSGGYWTEQGFCRYYVLADESTECPAEQNGCREYTGGAGRNATTILTQTFENGTYEDFTIADLPKSPSDLSISNESLATEGHSLYVRSPGSGIAGVETVQISNSQTYLDDDDTTCDGSAENGVCTLTNDVDGDGNDDEECTITDEEDSCGTLTDSLVEGKTYVLEFWAKGSGELYVTLEEEGGNGDIHDFSNPTKTIATLGDVTSISLDGSWQRYTLGPLDTSSYDAFDETAILRFGLEAGKEMYLDNLTLKQVEENITLIKDSWVVPSTCDQTAEGVDSDQYYLGCEAYTDQNGNDVDLYQFSDLCSEEVVGCEGFYHTQNSDSPHTQIFNARCVYSSDTDLVDGDIVSTNTSCEVDGVTYCTISAGQGFCLFDVDQAFAGELPVEEVSTSEYYAVVYGPETVVVRGDTPVYIVADDSFACSASFMGCQELGQPTYSQDHSEVESFESVYYINLPEDYDTLLCDHEALFCEEWESTQDGNFYFKDPIDKECEYKSSVTIDNQSYSGWFRSGTSEPCYWEDKNDDDVYTRGTDEAYLIAGSTFGVWNNGDEDDSDDDTWDYYDGWVGVCESKYDLCTEFIDVVDTGGGLNPDGYSYYFTNDELLGEENLTDSQRCNGQVSQKFGCALFNNTTVSELTYNTSASYILSTHADIFYGTEMNDLVDPVSCTTGGGEFTVSAAAAAEAGTSTTVDLCARRCAYTLTDGDSLTTSGSQEGESNVFYNDACFMDADCGALTTYNGETAEGTCEDVDSAYALEDDANEVLKVNRDRSCAAWVAGSGARVSWNTQTNMYDYIYDSIEYCTEGRVEGEKSICTSVEEREPVILSAYQYSARDVSWNGYEYSGSAIPNQLPTELYDQFNIAAEGVCVKSTGTEVTGGVGDPTLPIACGSYQDCPVNSGKTCSTDSECTSDGYGGCDTGSTLSTNTCFYACKTSTQTDYRLVYNAGPCDSLESGDGNGGSCTVGHCEATGGACASDDDCGEDDSCVVGYLQATGSVGCGTSDCSCNPDENDETTGYNPDCFGVTSSKGVSTRICDPVQFACVDVLTTDEENRDACVISTTFRTCVPSAASTVGACFNNRCLADIRDENGDGYADPLEADDAREQACRSYPEVNSPYSTDVVSTWKNFSDPLIGDDGFSPEISTAMTLDYLAASSSLPYTFVNGFQDSTTCALDYGDSDGDGIVAESVDCLCSYNKAQYGEGTAYRYFDTSTGLGEVPEGICSGGPVTGIPCVNDADCSVDSDSDGTADQSGTCAFVNRVDTVYGWNGYCLERDTSIQTLGSTDEEDQACLTWMPVDQLEGDTDLYGKYTTAGYTLTDTYYCADVEIVHTVQTSDIGCAEVTETCSAGGHNWDTYYDVANDSGSQYNGCLENIYCPKGYFAIMGGCGLFDADVRSGSTDYNADGDAFDDGEGTAWTGIVSDDNTNVGYCTQNGDEDCPYFCVPKFSYKTADTTKFDVDAKEGDKCLTPGSISGFEHTDTYNTSAFNHWDNSLDIRVYVLQPRSFVAAREFYDDCKTRGVLDFEGSAYEFSDYYETIVDSQYWYGYVFDAGDCATTGDGRCGYYYEDRGIDGANNDEMWTLNFYPACTTIVQTSTTQITAEENGPDTYNAAWTNMLWSEADETALTTTDSALAYTYSSVQVPFGKATDYLDLIGVDTDPIPHIPVQCKQDDNERTLPTVGLSCDADEVLSDLTGQDARSYMSASLSKSSSAFADYCYNGDCDCEDDSTGAENEELCNALGLGGATITCGVDKDGTCSDSGNACNTEDTNGDDIADGCSDEADICESTCAGGARDTNYCTSAKDCWTNKCVAYYNDDGLLDGASCQAVDSFGEYSFTSGGVGQAVKLLSQIFGRIYGMVKFNDGYDDVADQGVYGGALLEGFTDFETGEPFGSWEVLELDCTGSTDADCVSVSEYPEISDSWIWDTRINAQENPEAHVPKVISLGECSGSECYEGVEEKFTVNGVDSTDLEGEGTLRATVNFFAYADSEQMPIRRIIVDWGDDVAGITATMPWPTGSQSGSTASNNFYQNHRGLDESTDTEECSSNAATAKEWGKYTSACSSSYISFTKDYLCTQGRLTTLAGRDCEFDEETGRLLNSPCIDGSYCVYQPRVHVMDNWGWCTGYCDAGDDGTIGCFSGAGQDECDISDCPSEGENEDCIDNNVSGSTVNPWINYDGIIKILAK
jgi:hypothetical protein